MKNKNLSIIFDLDGTLWNSTGCASDIWNRVLEKHNDISFRITKEKAKAKSEGLTQKEFNDRMNNPDLYQIEDPHTNRSHKFELKETLE